MASLRKAVERFCRECNGELHQGRYYDCLGITCPLYPWKIGKGVYQSFVQPTEEHLAYLEKHGTDVARRKSNRVISDEDRKKVGERMKAYWARRRDEKEQGINEEGYTDILEENDEDNNTEDDED